MSDLDDPKLTDKEKANIGRKDYDYQAAMKSTEIGVSALRSLTPMMIQELVSSGDKDSARKVLCENQYMTPDEQTILHVVTAQFMNNGVIDHQEQATLTLLKKEFQGHGIAFSEDRSRANSPDPSMGYATGTDIKDIVKDALLMGVASPEHAQEAKGNLLNTLNKTGVDARESGYSVQGKGVRVR